MANQECVQKCIDKKVSEGIEIDDQALAICHSECYNDKAGNVDQQSLDNITKVDLLKKKKEDADSSEVTTKNKVKKTMPKKEKHWATHEEKKLFYEQLSETYFS